MSLKNTSFYGPVLAVTALVVAPDSIDGRFTLKKPVRVDRVLNLSGTWIIPPFAEAHNHNIRTEVKERTRGRSKCIWRTACSTSRSGQSVADGRKETSAFAKSAGTGKDVHESVRSDLAQTPTQPAHYQTLQACGATIGCPALQANAF